MRINGMKRLPTELNELKRIVRVQRRIMMGEEYRTTVVNQGYWFFNKKEDTRQVEIIEDGESNRAKEERKIAEVEEKRKGIEAEENRKIKEAKENRKIKEQKKKEKN